VSRLRWALALALLSLVVLVATAPARLLGFFLPAGQVVLQGYSGTLWSGQAERCLLRAGHGYLHLGEVKWRLRPWSLLRLAPGLDVRSTWGAQRISGHVTLAGAGDIHLQDTEMTLAASLLNAFTPLAIDGTVSARFDSLHLDGGVPVAGSGRLVWQQAAWLSNRGARPLGSYAMDFAPTPDTALAGELVTLAGPMTAEGTVRFAARRYQVDVMLRSETPLEPQLEQSLALFAQPVAGGYRVRLDAEL
jgi:hypothetical protein